MSESFSMQLVNATQGTTSDAMGEWQYVSANGVLEGGITATLLATKRVMSPSKDYAPTASMLTANIQFPYAENGSVAPHMTLQGTHDLVSGDENGTVTAVSPELAEFLGGSFVFDNTAKVLTVTAPASADARQRHVSHGVLSVAATEPVRIL